MNSILIGIFDGFHIGHRRLIEKAAKERKKKGKTILLTFPYPPEFYFSLGKDFGGLIYPPDIKRELANKVGVDEVYFLDFEKIKDYSPYAFLEYLKKNYDPSSITVGFNFRFGKNKSGNSQFLKNEGKKFGIQANIIPPAFFKGQKVSSTLIRHFIRGGNISLANSMLSSPYLFRGTYNLSEKSISRNNSFLVTPKEGFYLIFSKKGGPAIVRGPEKKEPKSTKNLISFTVMKGLGNPLKKDIFEEFQFLDLLDDNKLSFFIKKIGDTEKSRENREIGRWTYGF